MDRANDDFGIRRASNRTAAVSDLLLFVMIYVLLLAGSMALVEVEETWVGERGRSGGGER